MFLNAGVRQTELREVFYVRNNWILGIDWTPKVFSADNYTLERMTLATLRLAR
jgi:hypothetical protein